MKIAALASLLGAGVFASAASADIVHFVNPALGQPGHYDWRLGDLWDSRYLDITLAPGVQPNTPGANAVAQNRIAFDFGEIIDDIGIVSGHQAWDTPLAEVLVVPSLYTAALTHGAIVGAGDGLAWSDRSRHLSSAPLISQFPEGQRLYIGVRIQGDRLGWIEVSRNSLSLTAHAWAYQTEPDVPIVAGQVPAPASLALCGLGGCITMRRRRS